jgi:N-acetylglucosamine-6-phosphate deacetylase
MEATPEALNAVGKFLATRGTASFLATTMTAPLDATLRALSGIAKQIAQPQESSEPQARPLGIHLEGPFLSQQKRGVHPTEHLRAPDPALFDRFFEAAEGQIRLMTLAPELPGAAEFTAYVTAKGVRVSLGHSQATVAETRPAIAAGAVSATHTFNAMRPFEHREPGILGAALTCDSLYAEIICDGIHTAPETVQIWWRTKGPRRGILVTDAMSATGMPNGEYRLGGIPVQVADGKATSNGALAGSVLTQDRALANFLRFTGASLEEGLRLLTTNPAAMTGLEDRAGKLAVGRPANLVALNEKGKLLASLIHGQSVVC